MDFNHNDAVDINIIMDKILCGKTHEIMIIIIKIIIQSFNV